MTNHMLAGLCLAIWTPVSLTGVVYHFAGYRKGGRYDVSSTKGSNQ